MIKALYFLKMSWQFAWRAFVVITLFNMSYGLMWIPFAAAALSALIGLNMRIWPVFGMFFGRTPFAAIPKIDSDGNRTGSAIPNIQHGQRQHIPVIDAATENGVMTGFEPSALPALLPNSNLMFGTPGAGLQSSGFGQQQVTLGAEGEERFAKALGVTGMLNRFGTAWSVAVPEKDVLLPNKYGTDIDCIIATNDSLYLVDLKNYKSGNVLYTSQDDNLYCYDRPTGNLVGEPKKMSRNMAMAAEAVRAHFPRMKVFPVVVFMPTAKGEGTLQNVQWPGGIPAMTLSQFLQRLSTEQVVQNGSNAYGALQRMTHLIKK